jgi:hypothetical protein
MGGEYRKPPQRAKHWLGVPTLRQCLQIRHSAPCIALASDTPARRRQRRGGVSRAATACLAQPLRAIRWLGVPTLRQSPQIRRSVPYAAAARDTPARRRQRRGRVSRAGTACLTQPQRAGHWLCVPTPRQSPQIWHSAPCAASAYGTLALRYRRRGSAAYAARASETLARRWNAEAMFPTLARCFARGDRARASKPSSPSSRQRPSRCRGRELPSLPSPLHDIFDGSEKLDDKPFNRP